jgi:predicted CXXCH cytochrome family protein
MNCDYDREFKAVPKWSVFIAVIAILLFTASTSTAGIANTKHNLTNPDNDVYTTSIEQICAFCHTPHGGDSSAPVPLWNKGLPDGTTYTTYASLGTSTLDSEQGDIGSVSLACLSCHDGATALDVMINAPGSGWGAGDGTPTAQGYSFVGSNQFGTGALTGVSFIDTDLQNDHPISIQYGGGGIDYDSPANPTVDEDFAPPIYADIGGARVWWIETPVGTTGKRDKTDLPLYTRENAYTGQTSAEPFVECASCHTPHSENVTFLRTPDVAGAQLCQHCHTL